MQYETEEQQLEAIRQWFQKHGRGLFTTALFVAALVMGVRYWLHHKEVVLEEASEQYMSLMMNQQQEDQQSAKAKAKYLIDEYPHTPYAAMASLNLAKIAVEDKQYEEAISHLKWVIENTRVKEFEWVARARAARILMNENKLTEALDLLSARDPDGYMTLVMELKGDIYLLQNKKEEAVKAYESAYNAAHERDMQQPLLKMKLQELGYTPKGEEQS